MRKIVAALSTVVMLAAVTAVAQEKPKSGHEGMAKAGGAKSDASIIAKATSTAVFGKPKRIMSKVIGGAPNASQRSSRHL